MLFSGKSNLQDAQNGLYSIRPSKRAKTRSLPSKPNVEIDGCLKNSYGIRKDMRLLKTFSSKAAGSGATEAYPWGYVARRRATENAAGGCFQQL